MATLGSKLSSDNIEDWPELSDLGAGQPLDATLTALAALNATAGIVEQTGADAFTKRLIGVAGASSIPTRSDADTRYAAFSHGHANTDISGLGTLSTQSGTFSGTSSGTNTGDQDLSALAPKASPVFTGTVTIPTPFTLGAVSVLPTGTELNFVDGVTSGIQGQLDAKAPLASPTFTGTVTIPTPFTLGAVSVLPTGTELNFVDGVTSGIQGQLDGKQVSDATLTALAGLNATAGLVEQTGADAFTKRLIGVANSTDIPTRADGDTRFAANSHAHAQADVTNLVTDLAAKQATLVSGTNIKTINGATVLGSGDLVISGSAADLALAPASNQSVTAGLSRYLPDYYEVVDTFETEIGVEAVMEVG